MLRMLRNPNPIPPIILLLSCLLCLLPGCAPHRRGKLPPLSDQPAGGPQGEQADRSRPVRGHPARVPKSSERPPVETPADTSSGAESATEAETASVTGQEVCRLAMEHLGTPYRFGGSTAKGFDCSGFARFIFKKVGIELPRSSVEQSRAGRHVPKDELRVGDLLCFNNGRGRISHVGIYIGHGDFIHSTSTGGRVQIDSLGEPWWTKSLEAIRRVLPE